MHIATQRKLERDSLQKLYVQMYSIIKEKIETQEWPKGSQIPTEDELCRNYDVSKATVRNAVSELVRSGYLKKQQGKGTFVIYTKQDLGITMKTKLAEDMFGEGVKAKKELLARGLKEPAAEMKSILRLNGGERDIYHILCKRLVNGETAYLEESYVRLSVFPEIEDEDVCRVPFYELIQERGEKQVMKVVQTIEVSEAYGHAASLLKIPEGTPALLLHRLLIGDNESPVAYTRLLGPGRKYKIMTEFERIK